MIEPAPFKKGMRRLASGVSLVTTIDEGIPHGLLATSVSSVSASPDPCLLICVNRSASAHDHIRESGIFCVNLLGAEEKGWAEKFVNCPREKRFHDRDWATLSTGAPTLSHALASFDCRIFEAVTVNSHTVFIGYVVALQVADDDMAPLLYLDGNFLNINQMRAQLVHYVVSPEGGAAGGRS